MSENYAVPQQQGQVLIVRPSNPSPGNDFIHNVPDNKRQWILGCEFKIVTEINGTARAIGLEISDGGVRSRRIRFATTHAVDATFTYFIEGGYPSNDQVISAETFSWMWPSAILLPTWVFRIIISGIQSGDQISNIRLTVLEWNEQN